MNVLLIMPLSYGYYKTIIESLTKKGDNYYFIPDFDESFFKRAIRKFISIKGIQNKYIRKELKIVKNKEFDIVTIIRGYGYNYDTILLLKKMYPRAKFVLYQWDPITISHFDLKAMTLFDKLYSFDKNDCEKYGMRYFPLFYQKRDFSEEAIKYDFSFIGAGHSQRLFVLGRIMPILKQEGYSFLIKVYINRFVYYWGLLRNLPGFRSFPKECLSFNPVAKEYANLVVSQSKVIIDVHHPKQTGLSIRVMEVLGAKKRIITTNKTILTEPFYSSNVIGIIDDCKLPSNIDELLSGNNYVDVDMYEVNNWVKKIILD